jgi:hypothetical protein
MSVLNLLLFVYGVVSDMFCCVLGHYQGQHMQRGIAAVHEYFPRGWLSTGHNMSEMTL